MLLLFQHIACNAEEALCLLLPKSMYHRWLLQWRGHDTSVLTLLHAFHPAQVRFFQ